MTAIAMNELPSIKSRVIYCRGARATERRLFGEVDAALAERTHLELPVRIVVPSRSLRWHVLRRLAAERGALVGLVVQTAYSAAREVLERGGHPSPAGDALFELVVRRLARGERLLASNLEKLDDGFGAVVGVVRDLLDAGFQPHHEEAVLERLDDLEKPVAASRLDRARAIVRVAARSYEAMDVSGSWRSAHAFESAAGLIHGGGERWLPSSTVFIHGFADVTGLVADFLESLTRVFSTAVLLDRPERPGDPSRDEPGLAFLDRLEARFSHLDRAEASPPDLEHDIVVTEAQDVESEMRWVAERARSLIETGVAAEDIGVVARTFDVLAYPLRRHLRRLAVPHSGVGETVAGGGCQRDVVRLAEILRFGPATPVDLWIESRDEAANRSEQLLALRRLGIVRLADLAELQHGGELSELRERAAALVRVFRYWPDAGPAAAHAERTREVLDTLGWESNRPAAEELRPLIDALTRELGALSDVERYEWQRLFADRLAGLGDDPIGGAGGGVQILNATEARGRTFEHLFLIGLNRGVFPRVAGDDSMLPDAVRSRLALDVLPEMPVRARSADEERYLFAQLVSAACRIEVSWHLGAPGSVMSRSPFVADLLRAGSPDPLAPPVWSSCRADLGPRPPYEHAILAAGGGPRENLPPVISAAIGAGCAGGIADRAGELARARADILDQVDPETPVEGPNPWFGFVGEAYSEEPGGPSVTAIEDFAKCPLASFVTRRLGVAPMPDPQLGLPDPQGRLVGEVVHRVLEDVVRESFEYPELTDFAGVTDREPGIVVWPSPRRIEAMLTRVSRQVADEAGLGPLGMATLLAARSRPYIEVARRVDWGPANRLSTVVAAEVSGAVRLEGLEWPIRFRADRVDLAEDALILTDYKTGRPPSDAKNTATRNKHLLTEVEKGRKLQAAVYAAAPSVGGARGRYLWLRPDIGDAPEASRWAVIGTEETPYRIALERAATAVGLARKMGATFPRVEEVGSNNKPDHCKYCPVAEACRRDDSGFRRRFVAWMEKRDEPTGPAESAARVLWRLGVPVEDGS